MKEHIYLLSNGIVYREQNTLVIAGTEKFVIPIKRIASLHVYGNISISSITLKLLSKNNVPVHFFSKIGTYYGSFFPYKYKQSGMVLLAQSKAFFERREKIAKSMVEGLKNTILHFLKNHYEREIIEKIKSVDVSCDNVEKIRSDESKIWKHFYDFLRSKLKNLEFDSRSYRPPKDEGNAVISFVNSLLYGAILNEIHNTELSPAISYLHEPMERRISLVLDIADIFKPAIMGNVLLNADKLLNDTYFEKEKFGVYLSREGRKKITELFENKMKTVVYSKKFKRKVSIRTVIRGECIRLRDALLSEKEYTPFVPW